MFLKNMSPEERASYDRELMDAFLDEMKQPWSGIPDLPPLRNPTAEETRNMLQNVGMEGTKYDDGKTMFNLIDGEWENEVAEVLTFGAKKYSPDNWKEVPDAKERYYAAFRRHMNAYRCGELLDDETGKSHLAHASCCLMFLHALEWEEQEGWGI